jgi:Prohead core protein protease.
MTNKDSKILIDIYNSNLKLLESKETPTGEYTKTVIATLFGVLADFSMPTRNDRLYTEDLWKLILESDDFKESVKCKVLFGEPNHPREFENRLDTHIPYVSHAIRDVYIDFNDKTVKGTIDILDTPNGRIIKTLVDYGSILGISSRGSGDLIYDPDGKCLVDSNTYQFITWDIVVCPSNEKARLSPAKITEAHKKLSDQIKSLYEKSKTDSTFSLSIIESLLKDSKLKGRSKIIAELNSYNNKKLRLNEVANSNNKDLLDSLLRELETAYSKLNKNSSNENTIFNMNEFYNKVESTIDSILKGRLNKLDTLIEKLSLKLNDDKSEVKLVESKNIQAGNQDKYNELVNSYISARCSQLNLNESLVLRNVKDISNLTVSDIEDLLESNYQYDSSEDKVLNESKGKMINDVDILLNENDNISISEYDRNLNSFRNLFN